jgi:hypothetical protein
MDAMQAWLYSCVGTAVATAALDVFHAVDAAWFRKHHLDAKKIASSNLPIGQSHCTTCLRAQVAYFAVPQPTSTPAPSHAQWFVHG